MNSALKKKIIDLGYRPFESSQSKIKPDRLMTEKLSLKEDKIRLSISDVFDEIPIIDGMTLSFHHHLRNGDYVLNMVLAEIKKRNLKEITLAPSAIFPIHEPMVELIKNKNIIKLYTNYINGPVAKCVSQGHLKDLLVMDSHGGRPRAIETGELKIDVAFIATPTSDLSGNGNGILGQSACGTLGYIISDMKFAQHKVVITDNLIDKVEPVDIEGVYIDYVIKVDKLGDQKGILSGTTQPTKDPIQLKIAKDTVKLMDKLGYIKQGMSFQTGAGGTSIAVAELLKKQMINKNIQGSFASGGITGYLVNMLENGLFKCLYDVQCFDLDAVQSYKNNTHHLKMSASQYANPQYDSPIVNQLDVVILGATEVDLSFNVNVTTDSNGILMGGSGGHCDTAHGAKLTIITTNLLKSRLPIIKKHVTTITTPGESVDCIVTERGIAVNPKRIDLIEKLMNSGLNVISIESLYNLAHQITGIPEEAHLSDQIIGLVRYRDGSIIDALYKVGE